MEVHNNMHTTLAQDNENPEQVVKKTVSVRLDAVPVATHNKLKRFQKELIRKKGRVITLTEAYYEFLKTR